MVAAGTEERLITTLQYGGHAPRFDYRVYGKFARARRPGARRRHRRQRRRQVRPGGVPRRVERRLARFVAGAGGHVRRPRGAVQPSRHARGRRQRDGTLGAALFAVQPVPVAGVFRSHLPPGLRPDQCRPQHRRRRRAAAVRGRAAGARVRRRLPLVARRRGRQRRVPFRSAGPDQQRRRRVRAGRDHARAETARAHRRRQVRAEHVHRHRDAAERAAALDAVGAADGVGRGVARGAAADALRHRSALHQPGQRRRDAHRQRRLRHRESERLREPAIAPSSPGARRSTWPPTRTSTTTCGARSSRPAPGSRCGWRT